MNKISAGVYMKLTQTLITYSLTASMVVLSACSSTTVKDTLGITRKAPDEFRVVSRPPLYVPPEFNLQPPTNGVESASVIPADKQAQKLVLSAGKTSKKSDDGEVFNLKQGGVDTAVIPVSSAPLSKVGSEKISSSEQQFLKNIGAEKSDPKVRDALTQQVIEKQEKQEDASWWDIFSATREKKDPLVNSKEEAARIKANKGAGKPVTEGATPEVKDTDRGILRDWFGW
jgi:hypothetical protein